MARHPETKLQDACMRALDDMGIWYLNAYGSGRTGFGTPDILACVDGRFVAFELKVGRNGLSDAQRIKARRIERSGGAFFAPRSIEEFVADIKEVMENGKK